ncbi:MAG: hypothetical protein JNL34_07425 [Anaerolineae bacterium]|nr:hypothetical protein [Anaerolineae bacterium]
MTMTHMLPRSSAPREDALSAGDVRTLKAHFEATNFEVKVDGQGFAWTAIDGIEVAAAARQRSPSGWIVRNLIFGGKDRFHVGIYSGEHELVLINLTLEAARYVVQTIAYYARNRIPFTGPEGLTATAEE